MLMRDAIRAAVRDHLPPDRHGPRGETVDALADDVEAVLEHLDSFVLVELPGDTDELQARVTLPPGVTLDATWVDVDGYPTGCYVTGDPVGFAFAAHPLFTIADEPDTERPWIRRAGRRLLDLADRLWWGWQR